MIQLSYPIVSLAYGQLIGNDINEADNNITAEKKDDVRNPSSKYCETDVGNNAAYLVVDQLSITTTSSFHIFIPSSEKLNEKTAFVDELFSNLSFFC